MSKNFTYNEIMEKLTDILVDDFEIERSLVTPEANLFEDLELDSIDAVDLAVKLQYFTDKKIAPDEIEIYYSVFYYTLCNCYISLYSDLFCEILSCSGKFDNFFGIFYFFIY